MQRHFQTSMTAIAAALLLGTGTALAQSCSPSSAPQPTGGRISGSWWSQYAAWCSRCGGTPFQDNTGGGCRPGPDWGKGAGGASLSSGSSSDPATEAGRIAADMFSRLNPQTNAQAGLAFGASVATGFLSAAIGEMMKGPSPAQIRQQQIQAEFARQEAERIARERAEAAERKHQALLNELKANNAPTQLALKVDNDPSVVQIPEGVRFTVIPGSELALKMGDDGAKVPLTAFSNGVPASAAIGSEPDLVLKFGDAPAPATSVLQQLANTAATNSSLGYRDAQGGLDTAATRIGGLPQTPPPPEGKAVPSPAQDWRTLKPGQVSRDEAQRVLGQALDANRNATETTKQEIAKLEQAPQKDPQQIQAAKDKLQQISAEKEQLEKKQKEFVDLSIDSLAADTTGGAAAGAITPAATVTPASPGAAAQ